MLLTTSPVVGERVSIPRVMLSSFPPCCIVFAFSDLQIFGEVGCLDVESKPCFFKKPVQLSNGVAVAPNIFQWLNLQQMSALAPCLVDILERPRDDPDLMEHNITDVPVACAFQS